MAMIIKQKRFLILAVVIVLISTWSINFNAEGAKNQVPTSTPTELNANAISPTQINLSWTAPTQNYDKIIVGYKIEQRLSNGVYDTIVYNTENTLTTYSLTGLKTGVTYTYRVSAVYSDDTSTDASNPATATPLTTSVPPPTPPGSSPTTNVKFDFVPPDGTILVSVVVSPSDYLDLQYKKDPRSIILDPVPTIESISSNLDRLMSYQTNHVSSDSVPAPLIAQSVSSTQINLSWLPPIESYGQKLVGYKVESKNPAGDYQVIDDNTGNDTTKYIVTGLTPGNSYTYRVFAVYPGTHSNASNEASATTLVPVLPVPVQNQTAPNSSSLSNPPPTNPPKLDTIRLDFITPDGTLLPGVILSVSDYQQLVVIKDPRAILSNVTQTSAAINNDLAGLIQYQNLHTVKQIVNPPPVTSNSSQPPIVNNTPSNPDNSPSKSNNAISSQVFNGVITSVVASGVVGIITWFVKTKVARKIAKEYHFTLEKFSSLGMTQVRIRNSGEPIEDCLILCEKEICIWTDTNIDKPRHIYEGSVSAAKIMDGYENKNPLITVKSGKKILRKIRLDDMAHA
jgi:fibronectin type III domain protein